MPFPARYPDLRGRGSLPSLCLFIPMILATATSLPAIASAPAAERATYDSAGKLTSLLHDGTALPVRGQFLVSFDGEVEVALQPHDQKSPITRDGLALRWNGSSAFPNGGSARFTASWSESDTGAAMEATVSNASAQRVDVQAIDYVIDVPRPRFVGGRLEPDGIALPDTKPADPVFFRGTTGELRFVDRERNWTVGLQLDHARPVTVADHWDATGRSYRVRVRLFSGVWDTEDVKLGVAFSVAGTERGAPARLSIDPARDVFPFEGFGANYCWGNESPVADHTFEHLRVAWSRHELKAIAWDREQRDPGPELRADFERIQRVQQRGIPWIISAWRLPERFYVDPNRQPFGTFGRPVAADRWAELLDLLGSYLVYLKKHYGAEPDLFSFNEPDLGVSVGFSAEQHRDAIKRIGARLAALGLNTKMLLGDTANPRDSHRYVLATAADADAMRYVGAVSFHSWGNGTPEQYGAWAEVAAWLQLPLLVGEAGVDPGSWRNRNYDSYAYGLREARQTQELLRHARPAASLYWQFTGDYSLGRVTADGAVEPTGRFWLMKHFTDLTPAGGTGLATTSDQADVLISGFRRGGQTLTVHVLNTGAARDASLEGLPPGEWRVVTTTELEPFRESTHRIDAGRDVAIPLPARSLLSLVRSANAPR